MELDLETFLTTLYVMTDELYVSAVRPKLPASGGPPPKLSDSEVLCLALAAQWRAGVPWRSERGFVRYALGHLRPYFPKMTSQSAFNRRLRRLWGAFILIHRALVPQLAQTLGVEIMDAVPIRVASGARSLRPGWLADIARRGHGGTNHYFYGLHLLLTVTPEGIPSGWVMGSANIEERWLAELLFSARQGQPQLGIPPRAGSEHRLTPPRDWLGPFVSSGTHCPYVLGDLGYYGANWQGHWAQRYGVIVLTPADLQRKLERRWFHGWRHPVETVFACLGDCFALAQPEAHTTWGLITRVAAKIAALCVGIQINRQLGRPDLALPTLLA